MRKSTYIYDLHENADPCFYVLQLCPAVQFCGDTDPKGIQYLFQVLIIDIHKAVQVAGKEIDFPFVKCSLDSAAAETAAPVNIRIRLNDAGILQAFLDVPPASLRNSGTFCFPVLPVSGTCGSSRQPPSLQHFLLLFRAFEKAF